MEVILLERVDKLGSLGETVKVKDGYARNYLLPTGRALRATDANRAKFEADRAAIEARDAERRAAAATDSEKLDGASFIVIRQAGESGQLYGSVSTRDIATAASEKGIAVSRNHVLLDAPIKTIGLYTVKVALHPEVISEVTVNVARTADEAEAQARGEVLTGMQSEREEARQAAEELFAEEEAAEEDAAEDDEAAADSATDGEESNS
jgi:large subunit ribosomal protein L9